MLRVRRAVGVKLRGSRARHVITCLLGLKSTADMSAMATATLVVGQRIRVAAASTEGVSRRALVLALDGASHLEIEYEGSDGEEAVVSTERCSPLLPSELVSDLADDLAPAARAERLKSLGNDLFKLRDASAALEQYVSALRCLATDAPLSAGARCLIRAAGGQGAAPGQGGAPTRGPLRCAARRRPSRSGRRPGSSRRCGCPG